MTPSRIALVTGGTSGVGLSMVYALASEGAQVHILGRNPERGAALEAELNQQRPSCATFHRVDLSSLAATRACAQRLAALLPRLDVLVQSAGVVQATRRETEEGLELTLAVAHFSAFLLTRLLHPALARAPHARVLQVGGVRRGIMQARVDPEDPLLAARYPGLRAALVALHARAVITGRLAEAWSADGIDLNVFHPGLVRSDLGRDLPWYLRLPMQAARPFMSPVSKSGIWLARHAPAGTTGQFFVRRDPLPLRFPADYSDWLWRWTEETVDGILGS